MSTMTKRQASNANFDIKPEVQESIARVLRKNGKGWESTSKNIISLKSRIRSHHLKIQSHQCCYCRCNLRGVGNIDRDREHILPKNYSLVNTNPSISDKPFWNLTFDIWNLSVACKTCNMTYKRDRVDHLVRWQAKKTLSTKDAQAVRKNYLDPSEYTILHPNLDDYFEHLEYHCVGKNDFFLAGYRVLNNSLKAHATIEFFNLIGRTEEDLYVAQRGGMADPDSDYYAYNSLFRDMQRGVLE